MKSLSLVALGLSVVLTDAFVASPFSSPKFSSALQAADAQALSDYMAKSHEEKLRAVKEIEDKKNAEIQALKEEMKLLQQSSSSAMTTTTSVPPPSGSTEELHAKLVAYQQFMSQYIVKAQEDKLAAVKAAEAAAAKKYKEQLELLLPGTTQGTIEPAAQQPTTPSLYMERNVKVSEAAKAGKSRWGDMETKRAAEQIAGIAAAPVAVNGAAPSVVNVPDEVKEADHGMRADGGVGGPSLAERVALGANEPLEGAVPVVPSTTVSRNSILYHNRNEMVSAAGKAGKSRWGPMEVEKASKLALLPVAASAATPTAVASPEVVAANHGLRNDGGVGGPSLAERVNLGAQLLGS